MKTAAVIAEFNPLHKGHRFILESARRLCGADFVLVLMSGDYVQRGEPALMGRHVRAEAALASGADLVLASPSRCVLQSAEAYARDSVRILDSLGCVDELLFASECGEISPLKNCANKLLEEDDSFRALLKDGLKKGAAFPLARSMALPEYSELLKGPNNILGIEYLKALMRSGSSINPVTLPRIGAGHASSGLDGSFSSAGAIRSALSEGREGWQEAIPPEALRLFSAYLLEYPPVFPEDFSFLLGLALLEAKSPAMLYQFENVSGALSRTIWEKRDSFISFRQFAKLVKSRSVTLTAVNRALLSIALGLRKSSFPDSGLFTQVLGYREEAKPLISAIASAARIPFLLRPSREQLPEAFTEETRISDLWNYVLAQKRKKEPEKTLSRRLITL